MQGRHVQRKQKRRLSPAFHWKPLGAFYSAFAACTTCSAVILKYAYS